MRARGTGQLEYFAARVAFRRFQFVFANVRRKFFFAVENLVAFGATESAIVTLQVVARFELLTTLLATDIRAGPFVIFLVRNKPKINKTIKELINLYEINPLFMTERMSLQMLGVGKGSVTILTFER